MSDQLAGLTCSFCMIFKSTDRFTKRFYATKDGSIKECYLWNDNDPNTWTWNIDHIIPQYKLSYQSMDEDNFKKCWALSNLRPMSAKQNLLDGVNRLR